MRVLVTGAAGFLGTRIVRHAVMAGHDLIAATHNGHGAVSHNVTSLAMDLLDPRRTVSAIVEAQPDVIVHAAAIGEPRRCEEEPELSRRVNIRGTGAVAEGCQATDARFIFLSTEQVFDGTAAPYDENSPPRPLHAYGQQKAGGERLTIALGPLGMIARVSLVYGRSEAAGRSASEQVVSTLRRGERPRLFVDEWRTPVHVEDVASAIVELIDMPDPPRVINIAGPERMTRYDFGVALARHHGLDAGLIDAARQAEVASFPPRPPDLSLDTSVARRLLRRPPRPFADRLSET